MNFEASTCMIQMTPDLKYSVSVCFNGDFYSARITNPPTPQWSLSGIGSTEQEAVNNLIHKMQNDETFQLTNQAS